MLRPYICPRVSNVAAEHACERACGARMARAVLPVRVARDDRDGTRDRRNDHRLRVRVNYKRSPEPGVAIEALAIQPLARRWPFQLGQAFVGNGLINVLDGGGLNL